VNGHTGERDHRDQHREREKWRAFGKTIKIGNFFTGLLRDDYQHCKTQQGHQQVSDEVEGNRADIETDHADQQITRMRNARVREQSFQVSSAAALRDCRKSM
jgi:hypothetical protein